MADGYRSSRSSDLVDVSLKQRSSLPGIHQPVALVVGPSRHATHTLLHRCGDSVGIAPTSRSLEPINFRPHRRGCGALYLSSFARTSKSRIEAWHCVYRVLQRVPSAVSSSSIPLANSWSRISSASVKSFAVRAAWRLSMSVWIESLSSEASV